MIKVIGSCSYCCCWESGKRAQVYNIDSYCEWLGVTWVCILISFYNNTISSLLWCISSIDIDGGIDCIIECEYTWIYCSCVWICYSIGECTTIRLTSCKSSNCYIKSGTLNIVSLGSYCCCSDCSRRAHINDSDCESESYRVRCICSLVSNNFDRISIYISWIISLDC